MYKLLKKISIFSIILFLSSISIAQSTEWKIKKTDWSDFDEKAYSEFVAAIGDAV